MLIQDLSDTVSMPLFQSPATTPKNDLLAGSPLLPEQERKVRSALLSLDPDMPYKEWLNVGMALKSAGFPLEVWENWSKNGQKYKQGECQKKWDTFSDEKGLGQVGLGTVFHMARESGWTDTPPPLSYDSPPQFYSPATLQGKPIPEREWVVENWIPLLSTTALYGDGGVGKSLLAMQIMTCVALGKPFLGLVTKQMKVLAVFCEDTEDELQRRQKRINDHYGCEFLDLVFMFWCSRVGENNILMNFKGDSAELTELYRQIEEKALECEAQLIVIDTAADTFGGNENIRGQVRQFIGCLNRLAKRINGAVLLCAHPSVSGMASGEGYGGSTAWNNSVRSRLYLKCVDTTHSKTIEPDNKRLLSRKKSNYAQAGDEIELYWKDGVFINHDNDPALGMLLKEKDKKAEAFFLEGMDMIYGQGRKLSSSKQSANYAPKMLQKINGCIHKKHELEAAMERLFQRSAIVEIASGRGKNTTRQIVKVTASRG